jgi:D-amino-acid dehydrogenase
MPGVLASVPGMLLDDESPLYLPLRYLPRALPWLLQFVASARPAAVQAVGAKLAAIHAGALDAHEAMARELGVPELFLRRGHLHLYPDAKALAKDAGGWRMRKEYGYQVEQLDRGGIEALEPGVAARYQVGMYLADHATILNPFRYVQAMARAYTAAGGRIVRGNVAALRTRDGRWQLQGLGDEVFDDAVVAAGAWSKQLLAPLGVQLALESQRGYHLQFQGARDIVSRTVVLADRKVFVTPMEEGLRVGGTVEIGGLEAPPDARRAAVLGRIARETFRGLDDVPTTTWMGHRPCMPDSVPVVGPAQGTVGCGWPPATATWASPIRSTPRSASPTPCSVQRRHSPDRALNPPSFPRRRESSASAFQRPHPDALDPRLRGDDVSILSPALVLTQELPCFRFPPDATSLPLSPLHSAPALRSRKPGPPSRSSW